MGKSRRWFGEKENRPDRTRWNRQNRRATTQKLDDIARNYNQERAEREHENDGTCLSDDR